MTDYFFDSSALIKRYVDEPGAGWVREIVEPEAGHVIVVSAITRVEIVSGIMRLLREGALTAEAAAAIRLLVDLHAGNEFIVLALTEDVVERAEDLLERHVLRAYDAVQLASALDSSERIIGGSLGFVSADVRLLAAAATEGLTTIDPNAYA